MRIGIVGHGTDKFTPQSELEARKIIYNILDRWVATGERILVL